MAQQNEQYARASTLRSEILAAPEVWLPRRAVLIEWLDDLLHRTQPTGTAFSAADVADLEALERFLRAQHVPTAVASTAS